jgi:hypothetical protein
VARLLRKVVSCNRRQIDNRLIDLLPALARYAPPAGIFDKTVYSAFGNPQLHQHLRQRQIDTLIVSGSETDVCVLSSILAAVDYGYRIIIAGDAVCSSSDEGHDALIGLFNQRFRPPAHVARSRRLRMTLIARRCLLAAWPPRGGADCRAARLWPSRASASLVRTEIIARSFSASAP